MSGIIYKCKFCRKSTTHGVVEKIERDGYVGTLMRCFICYHESALFRNHGKITIDESKVPERIILMPWDDEYVRMQTDLEDGTVINANKEIDEWLRHPMFFGSRSGIRGRWKLDSKYHKSLI